MTAAAKFVIFDDSAEGYTTDSSPTGGYDAQNQRIVNVGDAISGDDAVQKKYVDFLEQNDPWKTSVLFATTQDLNLSVGWSYSNGTAGVGATLTATGSWAMSIDGQSPNAGDRVLIKDMGIAFQNGIYTVTNNGSIPAEMAQFTRAIDADDAEKITQAVVAVQFGTANTSTVWKCTAAKSLLMGADPIVFGSFGEGYAFQQGLSTSGLDIAVALSIGADQSSQGFNGGSSGLEFSTNDFTGLLQVAVDGGNSIIRNSTGLAVLSPADLVTDGTDIASINANGGLTVNNAPMVLNQLPMNEACAVGDPLTIVGTALGGRADASNDSLCKFILGVAISVSTTSGDVVGFVSQGPAEGIISGATAGDVYFLQAGGGIGTTLPTSGRVIRIGQAFAPNGLFVNIADFGKR